MKKIIKEFFRRIYYFKYYSSFKSCGKNVRLSFGGTISRPKELSLGSNIFIGKGFVISARNMSLGNDIMIGPYFLAECDDHIFDISGKTMFSTREIRKMEGMKIENDVWIGGHVTVLKGVTIGEGSIIGAGSVVTKSLPPYSICFGVPCKPRKARFSKKGLADHITQVKTEYDYQRIIQLWVDHGIDNNN
jgi:acetyltransferase-like isoleucine patch superfamily enzyme